MATERLVEGWTQRLVFILKKGTLTNGVWVYAPFPRIEIEGTEVTLAISDKDGNPITIVGEVGWLDLDASTVYFDPDEDDLAAILSPYTVHWKIEDVQHKVIFIPKGIGDLWEVFAQ